MSARIIDVRDALAERINDAWAADMEDADEVLTPYRFDIDSATHTGRKVYVFPSTYTGVPATRADDQNDYGLVVIVVERYTLAGDPPDEWIDERVTWCEWLLGIVGNARGDRLLATGDDDGLWPETAECTTVYDLEELSERKLFVSVITLTLREHAAA